MPINFCVLWGGGLGLGFSGRGGVNVPILFLWAQGFFLTLSWKKGKYPQPQDKIQHLDFTKDPRPLYYKTPPCVLCHKNVCSKAVFGP